MTPRKIFYIPFYDAAVQLMLFKKLYSKNQACQFKRTNYRDHNNFSGLETDLTIRTPLARSHEKQYAIYKMQSECFYFFSRYLQEIGYTDTIIDVRSNRVRSLLGLNNNTESDEVNTPALNGNDPSCKRTGERLISAKKVEVNKRF